MASRVTYTVTPTGAFRVEGRPDGSLLIQAPPGGEKFLDRLFWIFLQEQFPGWSATSRTGEIILKPPEAPP